MDNDVAVDSNSTEACQKLGKSDRTSKSKNHGEVYQWKILQKL